jgi:hypothetical protein
MQLTKPQLQEAFYELCKYFAHGYTRCYSLQPTTVQLATGPYATHVYRKRVRQGPSGRQDPKAYQGAAVWHTVCPAPRALLLLLIV